MKLMKYKVVFKFKNEKTKNEFVGFIANGMPVSSEHGIMITKYRAYKIKKILESISYISDVHVVKCDKCDKLNVAENNSKCISDINRLNKYEFCV